MAAPTLFVLFCAGRTLHTVCYLRKVQPWRTIGYTLAASVTLIMGVGIVWRVSGFET